MKVVGHDKKVRKRITCRECSAIVEYLPRDVKTRSYLCMGEMSGDSYIKCPGCKADILIPGSTW